MKGFVIQVLVVFGLIVSCRTLPVGADGCGDVKVELERTRCLGTCPAYTIVIDGSGRVVFEGKQWTRAEGVHESRIDRIKVCRLVEEFDAVDFVDMPSRTEMGDSTCGRLVTDQSSIRLQLAREGTNKSVSVYLGCTGSKVDTVVELARRVDTAAGSNVWVGKPFTPDEYEERLRKEREVR